jgi:hypothetical protein
MCIDQLAALNRVSKRSCLQDAAQADHGDDRLPFGVVAAKLMNNP